MAVHFMTKFYINCTSLYAHLIYIYINKVCFPKSVLLRFCYVACKTQCDGDDPFSKVYETFEIVLYAWIDEGINGWMEGCMDEWMTSDKRIDECLYFIGRQFCNLRNLINQAKIKFCCLCNRTETLKKRERRQSSRCSCWFFCRLILVMFRTVC